MAPLSTGVYQRNCSSSTARALPRDRRHIREGIEEIRWLATLKPTTIGVAEYRDSGREYIEIAVLKLKLRPGARAERLTELVHRAVPYPVLLFSWQEEIVVISLAHKRWSQGEEGRTVLDGDGRRDSV